MAIKAREIVNNRRTTNEFFVKTCGKDMEEIERATKRVNYFSPEEAIDYGIIDKVLYPEEMRTQAPKFIDFL